MGERDATPEGSRLPWVDVAKGACIALVVVLHVTNLHLIHLERIPSNVADGWFWFGRWMRPIRMPLFFLISGLLTAPALGRPDRIRLRVGRSAELYLVWLTLQTVLIDLPFRPRPEGTSLQDFLSAWIMPSGNLWYLWALAAYVAVVAAVPTRLRPLALAVFAVVGTLASTRVWDLELRPRDLLQYLVWFALGAYAPRVVRLAADWFTTLRAAAAVAVFALGTVVLSNRGPHLVPVLQVLGVAAGLGVASRLGGRAAAGLGWLGRHTLSIYVLHVPLLTAWSWELERLGWQGTSPFDAVLWLYPAALTVAIIATALGLEHLLRRHGAGRLFGERPTLAPEPDPELEPSLDSDGVRTDPAILTEQIGRREGSERCGSGSHR